MRPSRRLRLAAAATFVIVAVAGGASLADAATAVQRGGARLWVTVPEDGGPVSTTSSFGPSRPGDLARLQLSPAPEANGTVVPVTLTVRNLSRRPLRFPDGRAVVRVRQAGRAERVTSLPWSTKVLAPDREAATSGLVDLGRFGESELSVELATQS